MKKLTVRLMKQLEACAAGINFIKRNNLLGLRLDKLHLIEGDFEGYKGWLMDELSNKYTYDELGNKLSCETPNGVYHKYTYNEHNKLLTHTTSNGYYEHYTYNGHNKLLGHMTSDGYYGHYTYNELGYSIHGSFNGGDWTETYDNRNRLLTHNCKYHDTKYTYNKLGHVLTRHYKHGGDTEKYTYDKFGNELTYTSSDGYTSIHTYDEKRNLLSYKDDDYSYLYAKYEYLNDRLYKVYNNDKLILTIPEECFT